MFILKDFRKLGINLLQYVIETSEYQDFGFGIVVVSIEENVRRNVDFDDAFLTDTNLSEFQKTYDTLLVKSGNNIGKRFFDMGFVKIKFIGPGNALFVLGL